MEDFLTELRSKWELERIRVISMQKYADTDAYYFIEDTIDDFIADINILIKKVRDANGR